MMMAVASDLPELETAAVRDARTRCSSTASGEPLGSLTGNQNRILVARARSRR